jgi:myosin heavy subunit
VLSEREELRKKADSLANECQRLSRLLAQANEELIKHQASEKELLSMKDRYHKLDREYAQQQQSKLLLEKEKYDLEAKLDVMQADVKLINKDLEQRELEIANLNSTIRYFEKEKENHRLSVQREYENQLQSYRKRMDDDVESMELVWKEKIKQLEAKIKDLELKLQDEQLLRRKAEVDINHDRKRIQHTLNEALERLKNSQEDVVDRRLVANLIVSYFKRKRSLDVLDLIGRVLNFDDDQKIAVGLKPPQINIVSSILNTIIGPPPKPVEVDVSLFSSPSQLMIDPLIL